MPKRSGHRYLTVHEQELTEAILLYAPIGNTFKAQVDRVLEKKFVCPQNLITVNEYEFELKFEPEIVRFPMGFL